MNILNYENSTVLVGLLIISKFILKSVFKIQTQNVESEIKVLTDEVIKLRNENMSLRIKLEDIERITFRVEDEYNIDSYNTIRYLNGSIDKLYNIITNLALYTQKDTIGPHNVKPFIKILEKDYFKELEEMYNQEFENFKIQHNTRGITKHKLHYKPELTEVMNKQRLWITGNIMEHIFSELRDKFEPITCVSNIKQ